MFVDDTGRAGAATGDDPTHEPDHDCPLGFCSGKTILFDSQCAHHCQHGERCRFRLHGQEVHELWEPECKQCRRTYRRRREARFDASRG